ncbi:MAG: hypothetical protein IPH59_09630 [bacterium]|nr:hypothetical protein [bacterium]
MNTNPSPHKSATAGSYIVEVKETLSGARELREAILTLTYALQNSRTQEGLLVIVSSRMTSERIGSEWEKARGVFRPEIMKRAHVIRVEQGNYIGLPSNFGKKAKEQLDKIVTTSSAGKSRNRGSQFSHFEILRVLLLRWLNNEGPVTSRQVTIDTGYSYPTVAKALQRLNRYLRRNSDRRIELTRFPHDEWARLVSLTEDIRESTRFVDRSGRPRTTESLLKKLARLNREDIAIGGIYGAKFHVPNLDLIGSPRLDLTVSCSHKVADFEFVRQLDAALEQSDNFSEPPSVVVHVERSANPQFYIAQDGQQYADPIECLLDLHEARLEAQAAEFLDELIRKRVSTNG